MSAPSPWDTVWDLSLSTKLPMSGGKESASNKKEKNRTSTVEGRTFGLRTSRGRGGGRGGRAVIIAELNTFVKLEASFLPDLSACIFTNNNSRHSAKTSQKTYRRLELLWSLA